MTKEWTVYADRVNALLKKRGMSQRELAEMTGCATATINRYLNANRIPKAPIILKTAEALHVSCDYLLGLSDEPY